MKRFFNILGVILTGAFAVSSCVQEDLVTFNPDNVTEQTLGEIQGCALAADGAAISTTYTEVDFGVTVPVVYNLNIAAHGADTIATALTANISEGVVSFAQKDLNSALLNMNAEPGADFAVDFQLVASLSNDKGSAITDDESYVRFSNVVTATFRPYSTTVLDADVYDHIYVIGSAESIGGWSHDNLFQYLYDYNKDGKTYTGMIYYTGGASGGWKLTGAADWDHGNWGSEAQAEEAEAATVTLIDDGGSKDIKCYSKQYYMWTFDKSAIKLTKEFGFDVMRIVGSFNDWNAADENAEMTYNAQYHRFYIDVDFAEDAELKFTADGAWDLNFGVDMAQGGGNIPVSAGKYRIYLDFNKNEYGFDAGMYGKAEPGMATDGGSDDSDTDEDLPEGARAINILCEDPEWDAANLYGWNMKTSFTWPGIASTGKAVLGGTEYFYWTLDAADWGSKAGLIFNNGTVQTIDIADVTLDGDKCFRLGDADDSGKLTYTEIDCPVIKITYKNEAGWENVNLYGWAGDGVDFSLGTWPGTGMTNEDGAWVYELPAEHLGKSVSLIFNNGSGAQTVDLGPFVLDEDMTFDNSNAAIKQ